MMKKIIAGFVSIVLLNSIAFALELKEPEYNSKNPKYVKIELLNGELLHLVFDESKEDNKGYDILYADINLNNDITDDGAIKARIITKRNRGQNKINRTTTTIYNFPMNFESNDISYKLNITKYKYDINKLSQWTAINDRYKKMQQRFINIFKRYNGMINLLITNNTEKWEYKTSLYFIPKGNLNEAPLIKAFHFNKNTKLSISPQIITARRGFGQMLRINVGLTDENGKKIRPPTILKNRKKVNALLTIENEAGEVILTKSLKPG